MGAVPVAKSLPVDLAIEAGGPARVTPPQRLPLPLPRPSEPPPPAHVIVAGDSTPPSQSKPTPAPAINVMRIIAVGTPGAPPAELIEDDVLVEADEDELTPTLALPRVQSTDASASVEATELDEVELAPDSQDDKRATGESVLELGRDDALSVPPEAPGVFASAAAPGAAPPASADAEAPTSKVKAPPPPP